jgi:hypothetical protein
LVSFIATRPTTNVAGITFSPPKTFNKMILKTHQKAAA